MSSKKVSKSDVIETISKWARPVNNGGDIVEHPQTNGGWSCWHVGGPAEPTAEQKAEMEAAETRSKQYAKAREDSFERCDTDGFLSQWANGITSDRWRRAAQVLANGGRDFFPGLYTLEGKRVRARLRNGKIKHIDTYYWQCEDENGKPTGVFISDSRGPNAKLAKMGLIVVAEWAPAEATVIGKGRGLSGQAWAAVVRTDRGYPESASVILRK